MIDHLLEQLSLVGIRRTAIITREEKQDIEKALGRSQHGLSLDYLQTPTTPSSVHTLCVGLEATADAGGWALGYPDILFEPKGAYGAVLDQLKNGCDLALGVFPSSRPDKTDMVEFGEETENSAYRVRRLRIKQPDVGLRYTWSIACWGRQFAELMRRRSHHQDSGQQEGELFVGHVIEEAIKIGLNVVAVPFQKGWALDVGTPRDLARARAIFPGRA